MCGDCGYEPDSWKKQEDYYEQKIENNDEFEIDFNNEELPENLQEQIDLDKENE